MPDNSEKPLCILESSKPKNPGYDTFSWENIDLQLKNNFYLS